MATENNNIVITLAPQEDNDESFSARLGPALWKIAVIFAGLILFVLIIEFLLRAVTRVKHPPEEPGLSARKQTNLTKL